MVLRLEGCDVVNVARWPQEGSLAQGYSHGKQFLAGFSVANKLSHHQGAKPLGQFHHRLDDQAVGGIVSRAKVADVFASDFEQVYG